MNQTVDATTPSVHIEQDIAYIHNPDGRLIGTLTIPKLVDLQRRFQAATQTDMIQKEFPNIYSFKQELIHLFFRYLPTGKQRKEVLRNHWTTLGELMATIHLASGISTERFASPFNVHPSTNIYYSKYPRDRLFGSSSDAYNYRWIGS
jgi:hypothetical protein